MDVFRQLTRGINFKTNKYPAEAAKFGLNKKEEKKGISLDDTVVLPHDDPDVEEEDEEEEEGLDEQEEYNLTLLGDIKVKTKAKTREKKKKHTREKKALLHREKVNHFRNVHRIHAAGSDLPDPVDNWDKLRDSFGFPEDLLQAICVSYPRPTPIQMQAIPMLLERRELLACAPTGSGKTAAYLIPLIHLLREPSKKGFRAVMIAPTRELALQIHREAVRLGACRGLRCLVLDQLNKATKKFTPETAHRYDILVATPNKLAYMLKDELVCLKSVEWLVVDESDKLFEAGPKGFRDQLAVVYRACDKDNVRRAMFSATLAVDVENWCKLNLDNVVSVTIGERNTATETVEQRLVYTGSEKGKLLAFKQLVKEGLRPPVLVFVQTKDRAKDLHAELSKEDLHVDVIHSERSELQRDSTVKAFRSGRVWILICTELMGRGIDFKGVNLVVNYDFPPSTISYIHRIGRTGRAGRAGQAVTFFTDEDKVLLRSVASIVKGAGGEVPEYMLTLPKASRQDKRRLAKWAVKREDINQESKYDRAIRLKKEQMVSASKKRKREEEEDEGTGQVGAKKRAKAVLKGGENGDKKKAKTERKGGVKKKAKKTEKTASKKSKKDKRAES